MVGIGEAEDLIHHAQLAWMPAEERTPLRPDRTPPPDWFTGMRPAPWITGHVIAEGRKLAGASLVHIGGDVPADVPPETPPLVPAQRSPDVPPGVPHPDQPTRPLPVSGAARRAGRHRAPDPAGDGQPVTSIGAGLHRAATPEPDTPAPVPGGQLIIGIADAASYLGYDKPESFRRARTRNPIPGEGKTDDGRPCWTPQMLPQLAKQAQDRFYNRIHDGQPD